VKEEDESVDSLLREVAQAPEEPLASFAPGDHVGPYEIRESIGMGATGQVFRAWDPRLGRDVAVKIMTTGQRVSSERARRFEQEARAVGALNHPNILAGYDAGTHDGAPYVVFELLSGETLNDQIRAGALSPRKAAEYAAQIANGLGAAHEQGIVHRDLKPENLFVTRDGRVKILDFGLAKLTRDELTGGQLVTHEGTVLGTPPYMSPEQVRGQPADARSDIFALGAILYEMLAQRRAFAGATSADTMSAILTEDPPPIGRSLPPSLERIMRRCLAKNPAERFQSARDLSRQLESESFAGVRSAKRSAMIVAALLVCAGGIVWRSTRRTSSSTRPSASAFETYADGRVAMALTLGGKGWSVVQQALRGADGSLYLVGHTTAPLSIGGVEIPTPGTGRTGFVIALSADGAVRWHRTIKAANDTWVVAMTEDGHGAVVVAGAYRGPGDLGSGVTLPPQSAKADRDCFIAAFRARDGMPAWARPCGASSFGHARAVAADREGNLYMTGDYVGSATFGGTTLHRTSTDNLGVFVASYRRDGTARWTIASSDVGKVARSFGLALRGDEVWFAGFVSGRMRIGEWEVVADDAGDATIGLVEAETGKLRWVRTIAGPGHQDLSSVAIGPAGEVAVAGGFAGTTEIVAGEPRTTVGDQDVFVALLDPRDGRPTRAWTGGGDGFDNVMDIGFGPRGLFATGRFDGHSFRMGGHEVESHGSSDGYLAEIDPSGGVRSLLAFGGASQDKARRIHVDSDGTIRLCGSIRLDADFAGRRLHSRGMVDGFVVELRP
jgi:hypothetical protein